jgi:hypothetical protein
MVFYFVLIEEVANPPQTPTVRKIRHSGDMIFPFSERPKRIPITKLPIMFTVKVPMEKQKYNGSGNILKPYNAVLNL